MFQAAKMRTISILVYVLTIKCHFFTQMVAVYLSIRSISNSRFGQSNVFIEQAIWENCKSWWLNRTSGSVVCF